ncbi:MAG TPA: cytochrome c maturation protein CcmE [Bacteroidia bacterium]|jgi:cytochrome c-type biogenesis protein CcmE|nr:cytochrome c maturation protein CcmE [Bacteroidia bacterium]
MKKMHIIGIVIVAIAIGTIFTTLSSTSTYASFTEAAQDQDSEFHVVGKLNKDKETIYDPQTNANLFTFFMIDNKGKECKVLLHKNKPQDFERSEQIVLIGKMKGETFEASDILMKCPSKYNEAKPQETTASK